MLFLRKYLKKLLILLLMGIFSVLLVIFLSDWRIDTYASPYVYNQLDQIPHNKVGLVLGTSRRLANGQVNLYFKYRIQAAAALYKAGKIDYILVSGDNSIRQYNEPMDMKKALMKQDVPEDKIYLDFAGFRTLDSVVRGKKVFGQDRFTVISQEFHNKRAIYLASSHGIRAVGYNAKDVGLISGFKTRIREKLARVKVFLDIYILNKQPKFLGDKIKID